MKNVIYKISDHKDRIYIGSSVDFRKRKNAHLLALKKGIHCSRKMQNVYDKHGIDCLKFEVIEKVECSSLLIEREQFYIDSLKPWFNGSPTAGSPLGVNHSEETKRNHSERRKGKPIHDEAFRAALSERNKNRIWSDESKRKNSESKKGTVCTDGHRLKLSIAGKGRIFTDEHKFKIGQSNMGRINSESMRKAVSEANKKRVWTQESKDKMKNTKMVNKLKINIL